MVAGFKQQALLRIHALGLGWLDREKRSIEAGWIIGEEMATAILHSAWPMAMFFVKAIDVPPVLGNLRHGRPALHEQFPEALGIGHILWEFEAKANYGDWLDAVARKRRDVGFCTAVRDLHCECPLGRCADVTISYPRYPWPAVRLYYFLVYYFLAETWIRCSVDFATLDQDVICVPKPDESTVCPTQVPVSKRVKST